MEQEKYIEDIKEIKEMMSKSSRFISLSGLSGVFVGVVALAGTWVAYSLIYSSSSNSAYRNILLSYDTVVMLLIIAVSTLLLSLGGGIYFTSRRAAQNNEKLWNTQAKRLVINLLIPLAVGGLLCLILLSKGFIGMVAPLTLIFYGLALINASKYTLSDIRSLGLLEIALGLIGFYFVGYGLLFWALGFGLLHIIYGIAMFLKYK